MALEYATLSTVTTLLGMRIFTVSARLIDHSCHGRYDHRDEQATYSRGDRVNRPKRADVAALRQRLEAGEWLVPGEVGALFGKTRFVIDYWLTTGKIRYRRTPGRVRECNPEDVRKLLAEYETVRSGPGDEPAPGPDGGGDQGQEP
jgi:hypothetical protein